MGFELPEILNITQQLQDIITGKTLVDIIVSDRCASLIKMGMCNLDKRKDDIINSNVVQVFSNGKWIFTEFNNGKLLLLGELIGKLLYHKDYSEIPKKYHVLFVFNNNIYLSFQSSLYGMLQVADKDSLSNHKYAGDIGISPGDKDFTYSYFKDILSRHNDKPLKALLGLQKEISGLGNCYINDILYESELHPKIKVSQINDSERKKIFDAIVDIIRSAIELKGAANEIDLTGRPGRYTRLMDKEIVNTECRRCGTRIIKMNVLGSSSYICPECQKI